MKLTRAQRESLHRVWLHQRPPLNYRDFRRTVQPELYGNAVLVHVNGMWIGIEADGYAHS